MRSNEESLILRPSLDHLTYRKLSHLLHCYNFLCIYGATTGLQVRHNDVDIIPPHTIDEVEDLFGYHSHIFDDSTVEMSESWHLGKCLVFIAIMNFTNTYLKGLTENYRAVVGYLPEIAT